MADEDQIYDKIEALDQINPALAGLPEEFEAQAKLRPPAKWPIAIAEESGISGLVHSSRLEKALGLPKVDITEDMYQGIAVCPYVEMARLVAPTMEGAPVIDPTYIEITVGGDAGANSSADHLLVTFGTDHRTTFSLLAPTSQGFPIWWRARWELHDEYKQWAEQIPTDDWDDITLRNPSDDPLQIGHITVVHSGVTILDWDCNVWLVRGTEGPYSRLGLGPMILATKLKAVDNTSIPQIHWAARELGKTDGRKYGTTNAWCSEFASWCLRKALWQTPTGDVDNQQMADYFAHYKRLYSKDDVFTNNYVLNKGDYLRYWVPSKGGHHSALFIRYIGDSSNPSNSTLIETISGNTLDGTVAIGQPTLELLRSVGSTR
jgi:hypothetical protein